MSDPMIGMKIAMTGLVLLVVFSMLYKVGKEPPVTPGYRVFATIAFSGFCAIPGGFLIQIWS